MGGGGILSGQRPSLSLLCGGSLAAAAAVSLAAVAIRSNVRRGMPARDQDPVATQEGGTKGDGEEGAQIPATSQCPSGGSIQDRDRVVRLYEAYIHLGKLRGVWSAPVTSNPILEPSFVAMMHSVELSFLLLADFLEDSRAYIVMQHRIELTAKDVSRSSLKKMAAHDFLIVPPLSIFQLQQQE